MRLSDSNTDAVPYMDYWYVVVLMSMFDVADRSTSTAVALLHTTVDYVARRICYYCQVCPNCFFDTTRRIIHLRPARQARGGGTVSNTASSFKRHPSFNIKSNTGYDRKLPPRAIQNRAQGAIQSHPPLLHRSQHRGR